MPKRSSKPDFTQIALCIVQESTASQKKHPAAVSLGRPGGLKGGKARAEKLSEHQRKAIAVRPHEFFLLKSCIYTRVVE